MSFGGVSDLSFDEEGFFGHTRAIERLSLMLSDIGYHGGDGNQSGNPFNNYATSPGQSDVPDIKIVATNSGSGGSTTAIGYLGTLNLPIFGGSISTVGNPAGDGAVDWQQYRSLSTQIASGYQAIILGGGYNTSSGDRAITGGSTNTASGSSSIALGFGVTASNSYAVALGAFGSATGQHSVSLSQGVASGFRAFALGGNAAGDSSVALGYASAANGTYSFASSASLSDGYCSVAMGSAAWANADYAFSLGSGNRASGRGSISIGGPHTSAENSVAISGGYFSAANRPSVSGINTCAIMPAGNVTIASTGTVSFRQSNTLDIDNSFFFDLSAYPIASATKIRQSVIFDMPRTMSFLGTGNITKHYSFGENNDIYTEAASTKGFSNNYSFESIYFMSSAASLGSSNNFAICSTVGQTGATGFLSNCIALNSKIKSTNLNGGINCTAIGSVSVFIDFSQFTGCVSIGNVSGNTPTNNNQVRIGGANGVFITSSVACSSSFGCNGASAQTSFTSGGAVSASGGANGYSTAGQATAVVTLLNNIRSALVANGIMS